MSKLSKLSTKELFAIALAVPLAKVEWRDLWDEKYKPHKRGIFKIYPWDAVDALEKRTTRKVYRKARKLCHSKRVNERLVGAAILARPNNSETHAFRKRRLKLLIQMSRTERDPAVLATVAHGLGHFHREKANRALLYLRYHKSSRVRFAVALSLNDLDYDYSEIVNALIELSVDDDAHVRDWATYRLRLLEFDSETIREALFARLSDSDDNARGEAMVGLAKRKDQRVFEPLLVELERTTVSYLPLEAAEALADARLLPALLKLQESGEGVWHFGTLERAIAACEGKQADLD